MISFRHLIKPLAGWLLAGAGLLAGGSASAQLGISGSSEFCDDGPALSAAQNDRLLHFAAIVREQLEQHRQDQAPPLALVSRSGLDLSLLGQRYSHSGWVQITAPEPEVAGVWEVRQLYYACQDQGPRLFDQGLSSFVKGTHDPDLGFVSLVWLPPEASAALAPQVADKASALALLGNQYSANAYPFSERYQNCNQWTLEMLATVEGPVPNRAQAQAWLRARDYHPTEIQLHWPPLLWLSQLSPWLHSDDHPDSDLDQSQFSVSLPESLESFVRQLWPQAQRMELCHHLTQIVIHVGWTPLSEGCQAGPGDTTLDLAQRL